MSDQRITTRRKTPTNGLLTGPNSAKQKAMQQRDEEPVALGFGMAAPLACKTHMPRLTSEHHTTQEMDYQSQPLDTRNEEKISFMAGLGLNPKSEFTFPKPRDRGLSMTVKTRRDNFATGILPITNDYVFKMIRSCQKVVQNVPSLLQKQEKQLSTSMRLLDDKWRKNLYQTLPIIPSDTEYCEADTNWVNKRRKLVEMEKKRKLKLESKQLDDAAKKRKMRSQLKRFKPGELLEILPQLTKECTVTVEQVFQSKCKLCKARVFIVDGKVMHNCPNYIVLA